MALGVPPPPPDVQIVGSSVSLKAAVSPLLASGMVAVTAQPE
ncbi:hypothetical protein [Granulicella tundricola]|nr:hypothetical protein [Granulicella tundricola]